MRSDFSITLKNLLTSKLIQSCLDCGTNGVDFLGEGGDLGFASLLEGEGFQQVCQEAVVGFLAGVPARDGGCDLFQVGF